MIFVVQDRYQQQADVFRIMEIEKLISYLFLTFYPYDCLF